MGEFDIRPAVREGLKARIGLYGVAGGGKTLTALLLAEGLAPGQPIVGVDSEARRMLEYAGMFSFQHMDFRPPFTPDRYIAAMKAAQRAAGTEGVVIIDSASHEWLQARAMKDEAARTGSGRVKKGDDFAAWGLITPQHDAFMQEIMLSPCHIIVTLRAKMGYEREEYQDSYGNKKTRIKKLGLEPIQRAGFEFEFSVLGVIDEGHVLTVLKAADTLGVRDESFLMPGREFGERIRRWLDSSPQETAPTPEGGGSTAFRAPAGGTVTPTPASPAPTPRPAPAPTSVTPPPARSMSPEEITARFHEEPPPEEPPLEGWKRPEPTTPAPERPALGTDRKPTRAQLSDIAIHAGKAGYTDDVAAHVHVDTICQELFGYGIFGTDGQPSYSNIRSARDAAQIDARLKDEAKKAAS